MTETNNHPPDLLEDALEALRREPVPEGPPAHLVEATVRSLETSTESPETLRLQQRKALMIRIARYSSLSAAAIAMAAVVGWFTLINGTSNVAFGDVIKNVKEAKSVTLTNRQKIGKQGEIEFKLSILGNRIRTEMSDTFAMIADLDKKKVLQLSYGNKVAYEFPIKGDAAKHFANPIDQFRKLRPDDAKRQGDEQLDGKTVLVYVVNKIDFLGFKGEGEMKIWVDPKTKLPLKIRVGVNSRSGSKPADRPFDTVMIYEDFEWNVKLDPKQFELKVPAGYKTVQGMPGQN